MKNNISIILFAYNRPSHLRRVLIALENRGIKGKFVCGWTKK